MTKPKTKNPEASTEQQAPAATDQAQQEVTGDGTGAALPQVSDKPAEQTAEAVQQPPVSNPDPEDPQEEVIDAFVLCDGSLDGVTRYVAGSVVQGIPESLAEANSHWLDIHPNAVEHALNSGAAIAVYQQEA